MHRWKAILLLVALALGVLVGCSSPFEAEEVVVNLPAGGSVTKTVTIDLPDPSSGDVGADVMWLVDLSGSFGDDLTTWRDQADGIVDALDEYLADLRVGLSSFVDAPCLSFGDSYSGDYGYRLDLALTDNVGQFKSLLDDLVVYSGSDEPESQLEAMYQAMTGAGRTIEGGDCDAADIPATDPGWESGRLRFLLVSTDASFHTPDDEGYPYPTTAQDVINTAQAQGVTIIFFDGSDIDESAYAIAEDTNGAVFSVGASSDELINAIREAVGGSITSAEVSLVPVGDEGLVSRINPDSVVVDLTTTRTVSFDVTFTDTGVAAGEVRFNLEIRVNGSLIGTVPVKVVLE